MCDNYVLNHDFGYGREEELRELNRLRLRNIEDVKIYVLEIIKNEMICSAGNKVFLLDRNRVEKVQIELLEDSSVNKN